jgi:glycosyltransferase involved in cell wall biosynthesis
VIRRLAKYYLLKQVYSRTTICLFAGKANKDYFRYFGVEARKLVYCPHSVDVRRFAEHPDAEKRAKEWRTELGIPHTAKVLLFAGKFEHKKRPVEVMRAVLRLMRPELMMLLVGSGELEAEIRGLAAGSPSIFGVIPFQNQTEMPIVYRLGDVFILPSAYKETWGLAVNEAIACSRPIIVSDRVGCAQDVVTPEIGRVFRSGSEDEMLWAIDDLTRLDRAALSRMGAAARSRADAFDIEKSEIGVMTALNLARAGA